MIRIRKTGIIPEKLVKDGKNKRRSHCNAYTRDPVAYQTGAKKFEFSSSIYAHESVKQELIAAQHGKCCFCERLIGTDGDIEHFRPKLAYKQAAGKALQRPGYYWLAYEWDNLYLSCTGCNQRHKQNLFPLENPETRATNHKQRIDREQPLFIDPGTENPAEFIGFRGEVVFAIDDNRKGEVTINYLKLNQRSLPEVRLEQLQRLSNLNRIVHLAVKQPENVELQQVAKEAKDELDKAMRDSSEFTAAARCAIDTNFKFMLG